MKISSFTRALREILQDITITKVDLSQQEVDNIQQQITRKFKELSLVYHPDRPSSKDDKTEAFQFIVEAKDFILFLLHNYNEKLPRIPHFSRIQILGLIKQQKITVQKIKSLS